MTETPDAQVAGTKEWATLQDKPAGDIIVVREWGEVCATARRLKQLVHLGRVFGFCVEKGSQLPKGHINRVSKFRVVFQGNDVKDQNYENALFQDLGSNPASMQAGKAVDCYGCLPGHAVEQCDADQAYIQTELTGTETWIALPEEAWPAEWWNKDGSPKYKHPVVKLLRALYGHPDAGTFWEEHVDRKLMTAGCKPIESWSS